MNSRDEPGDSINIIAVPGHAPQVIPFLEPGLEENPCQPQRARQRQRAARPDKDDTDEFENRSGVDRTPEATEYSLMKSLARLQMNPITNGMRNRCTKMSSSYGIKFDL
jgi:hypothetical protein